MDTDELRDVWRRRLADFAQSGLSAREWCAAQGVSLYQYYYWRRRLAPAIPTKATLTSNKAALKNTPPSKTTSDPRRLPSDPRWLPVAVLEAAPLPPAGGGMTVRVGGAAIELAPGFDPALLRAVVAALGREAC